ncbi:L-threonylcarbamoyladenylate synthase [Kordiimonas gwangyangensis]|uniref:L-threonylcarbamoyladenylate synthase n=1 Tax=Kordiimonas gwangyangensis TaxID=288022 RepID=UPI00036437F4|nr:L-threonylcarbamoyladenylate synthase [Kordiimonas gwangyangensis]
MAIFDTQVVSEHEDGAISSAVELLRAGNLVAVPTETVYGLAADATETCAVQQIYAVKGRPSNNPLICHVSDAEMARGYVEIPPIAEKLMERFWPGPLTLVLPRLETANVAAPVSAGLSTLAVRCPARQSTRQLIRALGHPIAAPSANPSGRLSPTSAADVLAGLGGKIAMVIDGGETEEGIESTIIGVTAGKLYLLRPGTVTVDEIADAAGETVYDRDESEITAPGQLASHYAPNAPVRLNATDAADDEVLVGFGDVAGDFTLSLSGDLREAARKLFRTLRTADAAGARAIAVAPVPMSGIGIAINDRLKRAAAPRNS